MKFLLIVIAVLSQTFVSQAGASGCTYWATKYSVGKSLGANATQGTFLCVPDFTEFICKFTVKNDPSNFLWATGVWRENLPPQNQIVEVEVRSSEADIWEECEDSGVPTGQRLGIYQELIYNGVTYTSVK